MPANTVAYRRWYQKARQRALRRLEAAHKTEYQRLLAEEQNAEPYEDAHPGM